MAQKITFHSIQPIGDNLPFKFEYESNTGKNNAILVNSKKIVLPETRVSIDIKPTFFKDLLIFYVNPVDGSAVNNIIAINKEGKVIWKFNEDNYLGVKHRFVELFQDSKDELWFKNLAGKEYRIDHTTGKVIETRYENMDFDYEIDEKENIFRLRVGDHEHDIQAKIENAYSYRGKFLLVDIPAPDRDWNKRRTLIYQADGRFFESFQNGVKFIITDDGEYLVVIHDMNEASPLLYIGIASIYQNTQKPKLLTKIPYIYADNYAYAEKSKCIILDSPQYNYDLKIQVWIKIFIKPEENKFSFIETKFGLRIEERAKNRLEVVDENRLVDLETLKWFDLSRIDEVIKHSGQAEAHHDQRGEIVNEQKGEPKKKKWFGIFG